MKETIGDRVVLLEQRSNGTFAITVKEKADEWPLYWEIDDNGYRMCMMTIERSYENAVAIFNATVEYEKILMKNLVNT